MGASGLRSSWASVARNSSLRRCGLAQLGLDLLEAGHVLEDDHAGRGQAVHGRQRVGVDQQRAARRRGRASPVSTPSRRSPRAAPDAGHLLVGQGAAGGVGAVADEGIRLRRTGRAGRSRRPGRPRRGWRRGRAPVPGSTSSSGTGIRLRTPSSQRCWLRSRCSLCAGRRWCAPLRRGRRARGSGARALLGPAASLTSRAMQVHQRRSLASARETVTSSGSRPPSALAPSVSQRTDAVCPVPPSPTGPGQAGRKRLTGRPSASAAGRTRRSARPPG